MQSILSGQVFRGEAGRGSGRYPDRVLRDIKSAVQIGRVMETSTGKPIVRGTCEQWIKEGKAAIRWTRLSCRSFAANAVHLQLHALAYNLGNFAALGEELARSTPVHKQRRYSGGSSGLSKTPNRARWKWSFLGECH